MDQSLTNKQTKNACEKININDINTPRKVGSKKSHNSINKIKLLIDLHLDSPVAYMSLFYARFVWWFGLVPLGGMHNNNGSYLIV